MDRMYLKTTIELIRREREAHNQKFGDNPVHSGCLPNFDRAIENLRKELEKLGEEIKY